jgi:hypothetical protein
MSEDRVKAAEIEVQQARGKLLATLSEVTRQFEPHRLMQEVWEKAKGKGADLAEDAVDAVRARPLATTGVVAAITMFLAREPLMDLAGKMMGGASRKSKRRKKKTPETTQTTETTQ